MRDAFLERAFDSIDLQIDCKNMLFGNVSAAPSFGLIVPTNIAPFALGFSLGGEAAKLGFKLNATHGRLQFGSGNEADLSVIPV
jgi:hypothetical protein